MKKANRLFLLCNIILTFFCSAGWAASDLIVLGQSAPFSGISASLGSDLRTGILAALGEINQNGGIRGRDVVLISKDDGYEPYRASQNVQELVDVDGAFVLIGNVGTPTTEAIVPLLASKGVPLLGPYTGATSLRVPNNKYLIHARASYRVELEKIVEYLVEKRGLRRIACFYQNDSYGINNLMALDEILAKRKMKLVSKGMYERNTVAVLGALERIHVEKPDAVVLVGSYLACAEFIKLSKIKKNDHITYCNISFVGSNKLQQELGSFGTNVYVSQVVPFPWDRTNLLVRNYTKALSQLQSDSQPTFNTLEGYIAGRIFARIAEHIEGEFTRGHFLDAVQRLKIVDIDGVRYSLLNPENPRADSVYITSIYPQFKKVE